jgi:hypothetical protein
VLILISSFSLLSFFFFEIIFPRKKLLNGKSEMNDERIIRGSFNIFFTLFDSSIFFFAAASPGKERIRKQKQTKIEMILIEFFLRIDFSFRKFLSICLVDEKGNNLKDSVEKGLNLYYWQFRGLKKLLFGDKIIHF